MKTKVKNIVILGMVMVLLPALVFADGKDRKMKASHGLLKNETLLAYASTSGQGGNSGRIWSAEGKIKGIGNVTVEVSASWNWSFYNSDHPAALVNTRQVDFFGCRTGKICAPGDDLNETADWTKGVIPAELTNDYIDGKVRRGHPDGFRTDATVIITDKKNGDQIHGLIDDGSVTEIQVPGTGGGGSINEWFIGFMIDGGTGRFADATGRGYIHKIWDSGSAYSDTPGVYMDDPARFLVHEIFLHLYR